MNKIFSRAKRWGVILSGGYDLFAKANQRLQIKNFKKL